MVLVRDRVIGVWALLVALSVASYLLGSNDHAEWAVALVFAVTLVKVRLVGRWFMEIRDAPAWLRWVLDGYCVLLFAALVLAHWAG